MSTREELRSFRILRRIDGWAIQYEWRRAGQEAPATATEVLRSIDALKVQRDARCWYEAGLPVTGIEDSGRPPAPAATWADMTTPQRIAAVVQAMSEGHTNRSAAALLKTTTNSVAGLRHRWGIPARSKP